MTRPADQYREIAARYQAEKAGSAWRRWIEQPTVLAALGGLAGKSLLDLGCGGGHYSRLARRAGARRVLGIDLSSPMIELARRVEGEQPLGIAYVVGNAALTDWLGGREETFDRVLMGYTLNHAESRGTVLAMARAAYRALRSGGTLVALIGVVEHRTAEELAPAAITVERAWDGTVGGSYTIRIGDGPDAFRLTDHHWPESVYETAIARAGFSGLRWIDRALPDEAARSAIMERPALEVLVDRPPFRILVADRG